LIYLILHVEHELHLQHEDVAIYWEELDEDLSLRGFLVNELIAA